MNGNGEIKTIGVIVLGVVTLLCTTTLVALGASEVGIGVVATVAIQVLNAILTSTVKTNVENVRRQVNGHMTSLISKIPEGERQNHDDADRPE